MRMRTGTNLALEEEADRLIKESLSGVYSHKEKSDILTPWKAKERLRREVYIKGSSNPEGRYPLVPLNSGVAERHIRLGMFHRAANRARPDLNARDGLASFTRHRTYVHNAWDAGLVTTVFEVRGPTITLEHFKREEVRAQLDIAPIQENVLYCKEFISGVKKGRTPVSILDVRTLRELFRQLQQWRSIYESDGVDTITGPAGEQICLWDIEYLYGELHRLPKRQHESIELYLVQNMRESDAAVAMGVSATNPIGIYATEGLKKLVSLIDSGALPRFSDVEEPA